MLINCWQGGTSVNRLRGETLQTCIDSHDWNTWNKAVGSLETAERLRCCQGLYLLPTSFTDSGLCSSCFRRVHPSFKEKFKAISILPERDASIDQTVRQSCAVHRTRVSFNMKASETREWSSDTGNPSWSVAFYLENLLYLIWIKFCSSSIFILKMFLILRKNIMFCIVSGYWSSLSMQQWREDCGINTWRAGGDTGRLLRPLRRPFHSELNGAPGRWSF